MTQHVTCIYLHREKTEQDQFNSGHWYPVASMNLQAINARQVAYMQPSAAVIEGSQPSPMEYEVLETEDVSECH